MAVSDAYVFPDFLTPVLTQLFFPKSLTTFLTCFCRGKRQNYAGKKSRLNRGSNSQPPGHDRVSDQEEMYVTHKDFRKITYRFITYEKNLLNLLKSSIPDISTCMSTIFSVETLETLCQSML